ncbi:MAG: alkaline phosphatase family protein [Bacteroidales bacterium]|jgi:predicted AlkP superfamily pyrophosphatase or phosphodiesterase|nr:alkaline phosphatase family protein [Bacteroidales bacterium]
MNLKKKITLLVIGISMLTLSTLAQTLDRPKLVVGIVVDQMRWDYLYRYYDRYTKNGFKRMLHNGFSCENTFINYIPSYTAIGHATVYTGSVPAIHGIAGNDFIVQSTGKSQYCTGDENVFGVGISDRNLGTGKMSPANLKTTTITDELKLATNFRSRVIGIALKDRGSILPAGHAADAAYWFDGASGNWITSTWYMEELPKWLSHFNAAGQPAKYLAQDWNPLYPIDTYLQSVKDNNTYEAAYNNSTTTAFPVKTSELMKTNGVGMIRATPYGNTLTLDVARLAVENERLGQRNVTDFLAVSLSSPDYIGHQFTPNSIKIEDCYLRLDKELGDFFSFLDAKLGQENYLVFLTADHAVAHNAQFLKDNRLPGGIFNDSKLKDLLNSHLQSVFGVENLTLSLHNCQVNFNNKIIETVKIDRNALLKSALEYLRSHDDIAFAVETDKVSEASIPAVIKEKIINGYNRKLCGEIQFILHPAWYGDSDWKGTTHGSWNPYDTHIPLLWMGWGIKHGNSNREIYMTDIAPTLAALLHIQMPSGCIGKPIVDLLENN